MKGPIRPYDGARLEQTWADAVAGIPPGAIDPQGPVRFHIDRATRLGSAGSCFAGRIAEELTARGYAYVRTEKTHPFSARYGNIYNARHLVQLLERALGRFEPQEDPWEHHGRFVDPFRARAIPEGFASLEELRADRALHLEAVRRLFSSIDVFIFTLGLTEMWISTLDGAAFSLPPGYSGGTYDPHRHQFHDGTVAETVADLERFIALSAELNPDLRFILSVSPVPLAMTAKPVHVLRATTYSKAVLRVAAESLYQRYPNVEYLASYEIVMGTGNGAAYFAEDRRNVNSRAVDHVMRSFFSNFAGEGPSFSLEAPPSAIAEHDDPCDEEYLLRMLRSG